MNNNFVKVSGRNFVLNGEKIVFRGFGIGTWMNMEHFMTKMPGTDYLKKKIFSEVYGEERCKEFFDSYLFYFITDKDFVFLKQLGINLIRLPFTYRYFEDDQNPGQYKVEGFKHLDRVIKLCEEYGIYAILDLHAAPGGQNPDSHADIDYGVPLFWEQACFRDRVIGLWKFIADHYKDNTWVLGYDIINEPVDVLKAEVFNDFYNKVIQAIREVDKNHIIFIEGDTWATDFSMLEEFSDPQVAYSFHYYPSDIFRKHYPNPWDKKEIEEALRSRIEVGERYQRPLWCGETGMGFRKDGMQYRRDLLKDVLDILEDNGISWTLWAYKDAQAMGLVYPKDDTPWMKFVKELNFNHGEEVEFAMKVLSFMEDSGHFGKINSQDKFKLQFRLRGAFHYLYLRQLKEKLLATPWEEIRSLPQSFLWDNCDYYNEITELVKSYTLR